MPEFTAPAAATLAGSAVVIQTVTVAGIHLGLRHDVLVVGFLGSMVAIVLLNTVPSTGDTWRELLRTSFRRMTVSLASSVTAGYLAPLFAPIVSAIYGQEYGLLPSAFLVGVGAQGVLARVADRVRFGRAGGADGGQA